LQLIDDHIDLTEENDRLSEIQHLLVENRNTLLTLDRQLSQYDKLRKRAGTLEEQIRAKQTQLQALEEARKNPVLLEHDNWESDKHYFTALWTGFDKLEEEVNRSIAQIDLSAILGDPPESTLAQDAIDYVHGESSKAQDVIEAARKQLVTDLRKVKARITEHLRAWKSEYEQHKQAYEELQEELRGSDIQQLASELEQLRSQKLEIDTKLKELETLKERETSLLEDREGLLIELEALRARRHTKREMQIERIRDEIGYVITIGLKEMGDREAYFDNLRRQLKGTNARATIINDIVKNLLPSELVPLVRSEDVDALSEACGIGDWSKRIINKLSSTPQALYEIEEVVCEDLLDVRLLVAPNTYRELNKLSAGQKATVIILLALTEGASPVLFDQPEDSLDTAFVYNDVVRILRQAKNRRQFILATHNPNISIASHLDQGIVLDVDETAEQVLIRGAGSLDNEETKSLLVLYLEGGPDAFEMRERKYRLP
jgi:ABC-type dipeptide/oligopeptide/nickel transport system ATPase subunit